MATDLSSSLRLNFGYASFRPGQVEAVQALLGGQHTLVVMPTGAGKSLIYQLSALHLSGLTLVISPLIALMKDQVDSLRRHNIPATFINSAIPASEQTRRLKTLTDGGYRIVYVAPERLRSVSFVEALRHQKVSLLAVDEAHCISEWGHDFRPDYLHIATSRAALGNPLTVALTATATPLVQEDIVRLLDLPAACRIVTGFNRPNLFFEVRYTANLPAKLHALRDLITSQDDGAAIVYVGTRRDAEEVSGFLQEICKCDAQYYHAGLASEERSRIQEAFLAGDLPVVVATNAFGMGIDRPDVRTVVHYSVPGSLESYYQEAGRAGRDGLPARAVLFYDPQDRVLQEWFIENSAITYEELRHLYDALHTLASSDIWTTNDDLSRLTSLPEVKVRVGLAQLEHSGAVERLGDEGLRMLLRHGIWNAKGIQSTAAGTREHQRHRKAQLDKMIAYAETNACRRRILLEHFGDRSPAEAPYCCDNCQFRQTPATPSGDVSQLEQPQRTALIILDTVRRLKTRVGREKLAQILKGSHAADIRKFHYDRSIYYARLAVFSQREIGELIVQLIQQGYFKVIGGKFPVISLTPLGEAVIQKKSAIPLRLPRQVSGEQAARKKAEREAGNTLEYTSQLFAKGLNPEQIAQQRVLSLKTIYGHLARLIAAGTIPVEAVVPADVRQQIEIAIERVGTMDFLTPIKTLLPEEIDYGVIRCVVEAWKRSHPSSSTTPLAGEDPVTDFLSRPHPRLLAGPWHAGWALDFHSRFAGAEWNRSAAGELAYRLKYLGDLSALPPLIEHALALVAEHPELAQVDGILPVPPSTPHPADPVNAFAGALGEQLGLAVLPALVKTRQTAPQKEMHTLAQKHANVTGSFSVHGLVSGKRFLVVDDLFDSGATLEEITHLLLRAGAVKVCVLTLTRTIHSDA